MFKKIALTVAAIMTVMSVNVSAAKNPYNEMDFVNPTNLTIEDIATDMGITLDELKTLYGLPEDMSGDTNQSAALGHTPIKYFDNAAGGGISGDTLLKDILNYDFSKDRAELSKAGFVTYDDGDDILVMVKGKYIDFDVAPAIEDNRVLVPMRNIFTALGAEVHWQGDVQTVIAVRGNDVIAMQLGQNFLFKNNEKIEIPTAPVARDGRTLVPVRAVAEALDTDVFYNGNTKTVVIH